MARPRHIYSFSACKGQSGFTLVELLTVISIIVILSAMSMKLVDTVKTQSREGRAKSDLDALGLALEQFMLSNGTYPEFQADNENLSDYRDVRGFPDEKKSSEALFLALAGWHNELGGELQIKGGAQNTSRPKGYINLADFKLGTDGSPSELREQMRNLSSDRPDKPDGLYLMDPWRQPYLYKFPVLPDQKKPLIRRRMDYVLLSKGSDKAIAPVDTGEYDKNTWLSSEDAGLDIADGNDENLDNLIQGPSTSG